jgi:CheY-like chemotaxis protein
LYLVQRRVLGYNELDTMARILVVDDNIDLLKMVQVVLELRGQDVLMAEDGERAIEMARSERPDVVVCDLDVPGRDGWSVLEHLRGTEGMENVGFVLMTGSDDEIESERGDELGVDAYVMKPFDAVEFVSTVEGVLEGR